MFIRRLDPILIDQIAAGEVIERPAAAVKELVENAIDAGANRIDVVVEAGGRKLIRIIDDGVGMSPEDLALSIERHATSKIPDRSLENIATLGFRGEALPSIGAVARLSITSRARGSAMAHKIRVEAGRVEPARPVAHADGTRIEVEDLFFATPARLKFLKGDRAEAQAAALVIKRLAMANPTIRFSLQGDHLSGLDLAPETPDMAGLTRRIGAILGKDFQENAVPLAFERHAMRLSGLVSLPTFHRASAVDQYLFVNGRPVRDKVLMGALRAAYSDTMSAGRHPVVALFLDLDPAGVDVNVHPAKLEVRFREAAHIRGLMIAGIREALLSTGHQASSQGSGQMLARFAASSAPISNPALPLRGPQSFVFPQGVPLRFEAPLPASVPLHSRLTASGFAEGPADGSGFEPTSSEVIADFPLGVARAQLHETYIIAQTSDGLILVDQHAAHERLVYERLKRAVAGRQVMRQPLLLPVIIEMDDAAGARLLDHAAVLEQSGLVIEPFGPGALLVREVPAAIAHADMTPLIRDLADSIADLDGPEQLDALRDHVLKTFACHHSIRAGRRMKLEEMDALLREMEATPGSGQCNHGRPTYIALKLGDIERLFGRV